MFFEEAEFGATVQEIKYRRISENMGTQEQSSDLFACSQHTRNGFKRIIKKMCTTRDSHFRFAELQRDRAKEEDKKVRECTDINFILATY